MPVFIWTKYGVNWGGIAGLYWKVIMCLGHWGLLMIRCLSDSCGYIESDSVVSKFGMKNNVLKAMDIPSRGTGLVWRQSPREAEFSIS